MQKLPVPLVGQSGTCPQCQQVVQFLDPPSDGEQRRIVVGPDGSTARPEHEHSDGVHRLFFGLCPACRTTIVLMAEQVSPEERARALAYVTREPIPDSVPEAVKRDYLEALKVIPHSPRAAAALARRCLHAILAENGIPGDHFGWQIESASTQLPAYLRGHVEQVRAIGAWVAQGDGFKAAEIVDVNPGEAEWCVEVIEMLFDFYYVHQAKIAARQAAFQARFQK